MVRFALFGAGRIGRMHAANLARHPKADLAYVFDVDAEAAKACALEHDAVAVGGIEEALDDRSVDAVLIASSTDTHIELLRAAVDRGKAVLCEKPIDLDIERVDACWREIKALAPKIMVGFNRRFDPTLKAVRERTSKGELGEVRQVIITSRDPEIPPVGYMKVAGGLLRDMTIHDFDMARYMLGAEPVKVACFANALISKEVRELGDHDTAIIIMETASGAQCCINNYRKATYGYDQRVEVVGERGMLKAENRRATAVELWDDRRTAARDPILYFFIERYAEAYRAEIDAFIDAFEGGGAMPVTFEDGRRALLLANAAYEALRSGRAVDVSL